MRKGYLFRFLTNTHTHREKMDGSAAVGKRGDQNAAADQLHLGIAAGCFAFLVIGGVTAAVGLASGRTDVPSMPPPGMPPPDIPQGDFPLTPITSEALPTSNG